jgi:DNA-binding NtrC family response regulator
MEYGWPGNVRELENALERALAFGSGEALLEKDFAIGPLEEPPLTPNKVQPLPLLEKEAILAAVREFRGDITAAAKALGIGKTTLYRKLKDYAEMEPPANTASGCSGSG